MALKSFKFKQVVNAPPAEVYRAFTNATALRDWFCNAAQTDPRTGGRLYLWWDGGHYVGGEYTAVEPARKVAFTWDGRGEPEPTRVVVSFAARNGGTVVTVTHSGVGSGKKWASTIHGITQGWREGLENLQSMLETGIDLRFARRPMLGITYGEDLTPELATRLGVPATAGFRLDNVVEGMGPHAAGLQKDDVLVGLGGKKIGNYPALVSVLQAHRAGDKVKAVFYRGSEKKSVTLELSQRPMPDVPPTPAELAEAVRKNYAELDAEIAKLIEGLSEVGASHRPTPDAWSIKETLAHFIACERDFQSWAADMINDGAIGDSLEFRPNVPARLTATLDVYSTLSALLEELKRSEAETVSLIAALPAEFVARKHLYRRAANWILQVVPSHFRDEHFGLMQAAIQSARETSH